MLRKEIDQLTLSFPIEQLKQVIFEKVILEIITQLNRKYIVFIGGLKRQNVEEQIDVCIYLTWMSIFQISCQVRKDESPK